MRRLLLAAVLVSSGCANWSRHGVAAHPPQKLRIAVLPVRIEVRVKHLRNIETLPKGLPPPNERDIIDARLRAAADAIRRDLEDGLRASPLFDVVPDTAGAQVVLRTSLSGYGSVKRRWLVYLIGAGVVEGLAEGIILAAAGAGPWAAVGVGAEEAAQEAAEWGGGAYLFGRVWSPVILEGSLVSAADGKTIWSRTAFESGNRKELKKLSKDERKMREVRLRLTARRAAQSLVKKLERKARANLR